MFFFFLLSTAVIGKIKVQSIHMALSISSPTFCFAAFRISSFSSTEGLVSNGVKSALNRKWKVLCHTIDILPHRFEIIEDREFHELALELVLELFAVDKLQLAMEVPHGRRTFLWV